MQGCRARASNCFISLRRFNVRCSLSIVMRLSGISPNCSIYVSHRITKGRKRWKGLSRRPCHNGATTKSKTPPSSHSLRVSASRQQSFKRRLGAAFLPQLPPLPSARRVQRLGLYYLVNRRWCLPKSLPAAVCIPQSAGQMLRRLQC